MTRRVRVRRVRVGRVLAPDQRGSGTVLVITVIALAGLLMMVTLATGRAVQTRHRAQGAADLAALAAAAVVEEGAATGSATGAGACVTAAAVAVANQAGLARCETHPGGDVTVGVKVHLAGLMGFWLPPSDGNARAGPAS